LINFSDQQIQITLWREYF